MVSSSSRFLGRAGAQATVRGDDPFASSRPTKGILVPAREFAYLDKEQLELAVEELAMKGEFKPPAGFGQADIMNLDEFQLRDILRQAGDEVTQAPLDQDQSSKNWFMGILSSVGSAIAAPAMKILDPIAAFGEMGASTVMGTVQQFIPGEQQYERLMREGREARGLDSFFDWITDPLESIAAQREAWHAMDAPWGTKFAMEVIFDPLNLIPFKWFTVPFKGGIQGVKLMARGGRPISRSVARKQGMKYATKIADKNLNKTRSLDDLDGEVTRLLDDAATRPQVMDPRLLIGDRSKRGSLMEQAKKLETSIHEIRQEMIEVPYGEVAFRYSPGEIMAGRMPHPPHMWQFDDAGKRIRPLAGPLKAGQRRWGGEGPEFEVGWAVEDAEPVFRVVQRGPEGMQRQQKITEKAYEAYKDPDAAAPDDGLDILSKETGAEYILSGGRTLRELAEQTGEKVDDLVPASWQPTGSVDPAEAAKIQKEIIAYTQGNKKIYATEYHRTNVNGIPSGVDYARPMSEWGDAQVGVPLGEPYYTGRGKSKKPVMEVGADGVNRIKKHYTKEQLKKIALNSASDFEFPQVLNPEDIEYTFRTLEDPADKVAYLWWYLTGMRRIELTRVLRNDLKHIHEPDAYVDLHERLDLHARVDPSNPLGLGDDMTSKQTAKRPITNMARQFLDAYLGKTDFEVNLGTDANGLPMTMKLEAGMFRDDLLAVNLPSGALPEDIEDIFLTKQKSGRLKGRYGAFNMKIDTKRNIRISSQLNELSARIGAANPEGVTFTASSLRHHFATQLYMGGSFGMPPEGASSRWVANYMGHIGEKNLIEYYNLAMLVKQSIKMGDDPARSKLQINNDFIAGFEQSIQEMPTHTVLEQQEKTAAQNALEDWNLTRAQMLASGKSQFVKDFDAARGLPGEAKNTGPYVTQDWQAVRDLALEKFPDDPLFLKRVGKIGRGLVQDIQRVLGTNKILRNDYDHPATRISLTTDLKGYTSLHHLYANMNFAEGTMLRQMYSKADEAEDLVFRAHSPGGKEELWTPEILELYKSYANALAGLKTVRSFLAMSNTLGLEARARQKMLPRGVWRDLQAGDANTSVRALLNAKNLNAALTRRIANLAADFNNSANNLVRTEGMGADDVLQLPKKVQEIKEQVNTDSNSIENIFAQGMNSRTAHGQNEMFAKAAADFFNDKNFVPVAQAAFRYVNQTRYESGAVLHYTTTGTWKNAHMEPHLAAQIGSNKMEWLITDVFKEESSGKWKYRFERIRWKIDKSGPAWKQAQPEFHIVRRGTPGMTPAARKALDDKHLMELYKEDMIGWMSAGPVPDHMVHHPQPPGPKPWNISRLSSALLSGPGKVGLDRSFIDMKFPKAIAEKPEEVARLTAVTTRKLQVLIRSKQSGLYKIFTEPQVDIETGRVIREPLLIDDPGGTGMLVFAENVKEGVVQLRAAGGGGQVPPRRPRGPRNSDADGWEPWDFSEWNKEGYNLMEDGTDFASGPRSVADTVTDFRDTRWRKSMAWANRRVFGAKVGRFTQMPVDWLFGQNMGFTEVRKWIGAHASVREAARFRGAQVLGRLQYGGDLLGYSSRYGRMMNIKLTGEVPPHVENVLRESAATEADLYGKGVTTGRPGPAVGPIKFAPPGQFKNMPDWEWETRRVTTMLEMPRNMLSKYYELNPEQLKFYDSYHEMILRLQHMASKEGYNLSEYLAAGAGDMAKFGPDDPRYVPHLQDLAADVNRETGLPTTPILGTKPKFFESREFKTMMEGENKGRVYTQDPVEALKQLYEGVYGFVADKQFFKGMEQFGTETAEMAQKTRLGEQLLDLLRAGRVVDPETFRAPTKAGAPALEAFFPGMRAAVDRARNGTDADKLRIKRELEEQTSRYWLEEKGMFELKDWRAFRNLIPDNEEIAKMAFTRDAAKELKDYVHNMSEASALKGIGKGLSIWSSYVRTLSTTFDLGAPLIHGFPLLTMMPLHALQKAIKTKDPFAAIKWHETPWAMGVRHMFSAFRDPAVRDNFRSANNVVMTEMKEHGVAFFGSELREMTGSAIRQLGDMPGPIGKGTKMFETSFNTFLDVARVEYYKGMRHLVRKGPDGIKPLDSDLGELAAAVNKVTGGLDPVRAGISNHQRAIESTYVMFAPMLRRATAALIFKAGEGIALAPLAAVGKAELGLERRQALSAIGSIMAAMGALGYMIYASGNNKDVFDHESADFMSMKFGGSRLGIGTPFYALSRMGSGILNQMKEDPGGLLKWDIEDHAVLKMARSMTSPSTGSIIDIIHGRNFIGDPLRDADGSWEKLKIGRFMARSALPFWAEAYIYDFTGFNKLSSVGEFAGLRASPLPKSRQLRQLQENYLMGDGDDPELVRWRNQQLASGKGVSVEEAPAMVMDALNARHEDLQALQEEMEKNRILRGETKVQRLNKYMTALEENRSRADKSMRGFSDAFDAGLMDGKTFRQKITEASAELRGAQESLAGETVFKDVIEGLDAGRIGRLDVTTGYLGDLYYDYYRSKVTDHPSIEDEYGNFRPEIFRQLEASFKLAEVPDQETWEYIQRRKKRNRDFTPTVQDLYTARETLKPYWSLYEEVWKRGSWQAELIASYMNLPTHAAKRRFKDNYPKVGPLLRKYDRARGRYREEHPDADAALVRFYDYNPIDMRRVPKRRGV
jgi:integrase